MKITKKWLDKMGACCSVDDKKQAEKIGELKSIVKTLIENNRLSDANWLITRKLRRMDCVKYGIYAAKKVLYLFEQKSLDDGRPRLAIEVAEKYLKNSSQKNRNVAYAAGAAFHAAGVAGAADAAHAAYAAFHAAHAAHATGAADAAGAAFHAAGVAGAAYAAYAAYASVSKDEIFIKILKYGLKIIYEKEGKQ
jgi:hypothetical protein